MNLSQECEGVFLLQRSHCNYQPIAIAITMGIHYSKIFYSIWVKTQYLSRQNFFFGFFDFFGPIGHRNEGYRLGSV